MNTKDIRTSSDPDLVGSFAAMELPARSAKDITNKTNTGTVIAIDINEVESTAADLINLHGQKAHQSHY
jgi:hypothetical protein